MLKFISFGSGSSGNCYFLATETDALIIDIGVGLRGLRKNCKEYGVSLQKVHYVLVTHDHADHIKSVGSMSADFSLPIYATREVHAGINRNYCVTKKVSKDLACYVEKGKTFTLGDFQVTPFGVPHDSTDNVGYFIEAGGTDFCLITDAGMVTDEMKPFIRRAHHLVIEANHDEEMVMNGSYPQFLKERILSGTGHLSNRTCGEAIAQNMSEALKRVWLCHLSEENNHPELARKTVESILRSYGIAAGADLQLEVLKRNSPTGPYELE
jgi:phosphoribosyl 1,2-cyclic phosphodiesterase